MSGPAPFSLPARTSAEIEHGRRARIAALTVFTLGLLLRARAAHAAAPELAVLEYDRPTELTGCPDEAGFRAAVRQRLGRDPFVLEASRKVRVRLSRAGAKLSAVVHVEEAGRPRGERRIETRSGCEELAAAAALAVSMAIDPLAALGEGAPTDATTPEAPADPTPAPVSPPTPKPAHAVERAPAAPRSTARTSELASARWFVRAGERTWAGAVPGIGVGPSLGFGYRRHAWSLALDGFAVLPRSASVAETRRAVAVSLLGATVAPCLELSRFRSCALFSSAALFAHGEGVDAPRTERSLDAAAGLGFGYSFDIGRFSLAPSFELSARMTQANLVLDGESVWTTPRVLGLLGLELAYDL